MSNLNISIIIPYYNDVFNLYKCLQSILEQKTSYSFEIIVVDNNSTKYLDEFNKLKSDFEKVVFLNEEKIGSYSARNTGIVSATGEIIAFIDSDCIAKEGWLENGFKTLRKNYKIGFVTGPVEIYFEDESNPTSVELYERMFAFKHKKSVEIHHKSLIGNSFIKREVLDKVGLFDESLRSGGDMEWTHRIWKCGYELIYADNVVVLHPARKNLNELKYKKRRVLNGIPKKKYEGKKFKACVDTFSTSKPPVLSIIKICKYNNYSLTQKLQTILVLLHIYLYSFYLKFKYWVFNFKSIER